jgi:chitinase
VLRVLLVMMCTLSLTAHSQYRVIGYYPMWMKSTLPAGLVKFNYLTHINHAFAWPNADGSLAFAETSVDTGLIGATHRGGRKIFLSFGGAGTLQTANLATVAADPALRASFIANVVAHLQAYKYDGADMDWEGPQTRADKVNEIALTREMYAAFHAADTSWRISMAVGVSDWSGQWHDFDSLRQYIGWFNAMTYDFHGGWSAHAGHNAPLYAPQSDPDGSVDQGIQYLHQQRSIPGGQIVLGLPFYGHEFQASVLYGPKTEPTVDVVYSDIPAKLAANWSYNWDAVSQVPYLLNPGGNRLTSYDDTTSLALKCSYAKTGGLSGVMIWAIGQDITAGRQPLMDAVGKAMAIPTDVVTAGGLPVQFTLEQNFPNPFNPSTTIRFILPAKSHVRLAVFTILGEEVATLVDAPQEAGMHDVRFDGARLATGVYVCRVTAGETVRSVKILLVR